MKKLLKSIFVIVILIFTNGSAYTQKHQAGVMFGYGRTNCTNDFRPFLIPLFDNDGSTTILDNYYNIGICYYYTPAKYRFSIKTGINYDCWDGYFESNVGFLNIPLGIDFSVGNKFRFIYGLGIYSGLLISKIEYIEINKPRLGFEANIGFEVPISSKLSLCAGYQHNIGITNFYREHRVSPGGTHYTTRFRRTDAMINVSVKYTIL